MGYFGVWIFSWKLLHIKQDSIQFYYWVITSYTWWTVIKNSYVHPCVFLPLTVGCDLCDLLPEQRLVSCCHNNSSSLEISLQRVVEAHPWVTTASRTANWDKHERFIKNGVLAPQHMPSPSQSLSLINRVMAAQRPAFFRLHCTKGDNRSAGEEHVLPVWWSSHRGNIDLSHWTRRATGHRAMKQKPQNWWNVSSICCLLLSFGTRVCSGVWRHRPHSKFCALLQTVFFRPLLCGFQDILRKTSNWLLTDCYNR